MFFSWFFIRFTQNLHCIRNDFSQVNTYRCVFPFIHMVFVYTSAACGTSQKVFKGNKFIIGE